MTGSYERGSKIGRFVVVTELGRGGMGAVYAAHDPQLDRQVALKVMRDASGEEEDRVRMLREGQAMARITHPNVITVYEVGTESGIVFLAQELLDGGTLGSWLEHAHPQRAVLEKFIAAGRGLAAAHAVGLVHRDFKPDNVLLGKDGRVRVADFGLARAESALADALAITTKGGGPVAHNVDLTRSPMSPLTRTGAVMGTPMFMAPEQHKGERADARSDQFAFCVSLYHALYKAWPFEGKTAPALADAVIAGRLATPPANARVPASLRKILLRGLATEPADRYPSMEALLADLEREAGIAAPASKSRAPLAIVGAFVVLAGGGAGAYAVMQSRTSESKPPPVVTATPKPPATTEELLTSAQGIEWLSAAIDRGQFVDTFDKFKLRASASPNRPPAESAIDAAVVAYLRVLQGELKEADAAIAAATKDAGSDATATACIDLAESALALARGQLPAARDRSAQCAKQLASTTPVLAAICYQVHGEAQAALGDNASARQAYDAGLALATQAASKERTSSLQLALAQLALDEGDTKAAKELATRLQEECDERNAIGCDVRARILLARIERADPSNEDPLPLLTAVRAKTIESTPVRLAYDIALGEMLGYRREADDKGKTGLDHIETARASAEVKGLTLLVLEAKLARLRVLLTTDDQQDHKPLLDELVQQARKDKVERIARLAEAAFAELSEPPRDMLPGDGGLPAVRSGSPDEP